MAIFSSPEARSSHPIVLSPSVQGQVYGLFTLALGLTVVGVYFGLQFGMLMTGGTLMLLLLIELALVLTSRWWIDRTPLNYLLFGLFPLLSGFTLTPYLVVVTEAYVNGGAILVNALLATVCMAGAAAIAALVTGWNLSGLGRVLFLSVIGLVVVGLLQLFFPGLRTGQAELVISGCGVIIFAAFTAYDIQRVAALGRAGASPFLLALSLYLDIFNLFLYVFRFMLAASGRRR